MLPWRIAVAPIRRRSSFTVHAYPLLALFFLHSAKLQKNLLSLHVFPLFEPTIPEINKF